MKLKFSILVLSLILIPVHVFSSDIGARAVGFGGCYSSISDDSTAVFWNPAGMMQLLQKEIGVFYNAKDTFTATAFTYVYPTETSGYFGVGLFKQDNFEEETDNETLAAVSYSRNIRHNLSIGFTLKNISRTKGNESDSKINADIGLIYKPIKKGSVGFTLQNITSQELNYHGYTHPIPTNYRMGLTYYLIMWREKLVLEKYLPTGDKKAPVAGEKFLISVDIEKNEFSENPFVYKAIEFWIGDVFGFRIGSEREEFKHGNTWDCLFAIKSPIIGLSYKRDNIQIDLSYKKPENPIGISVNYRFGKKILTTEYGKWEIEKRAQQYYRTGEKYYGDGKLAQAIIEWEKVLIWQPENVELEEKVTELQNELEEVAGKKLIENYITQAYLNYEEGKLLDSLENWEEISKLDPGNTQAERYIERINSKLTESEKQNYVKRTKEKLKLNIVDHLRKGDIYFERRKYNDAIKEWGKILEFNPGHNVTKENIERTEKKITELTSLHYDKGLELYNSRQFTKSATEFRKVLEFNPQHSESKQYLNRIRDSVTRKTNAKEISQMYYTAADLYFEGKYEDSLKILNNLLEKDPLNENAIKLLNKVKSIIEKLGQ